MHLPSSNLLSRAPDGTSSSFSQRMANHRSLFEKRDSGGSQNTLIIAIIIVAVIIGSIVIYFGLDRLRRKYNNPKYIPTSFLKKKWTNWAAQSKTRASRRTNSDHLEPIQEAAARRMGSNQLQQPSTAASRSSNATRNVSETQSAGVGRNTSVRSVMTLPPYMYEPGESEQVLGREGERGGIDTIVEFPDIAEQAEEERREEEMEALYQVRLARRNEIAEREERRRLRREARERGDNVALNELRSQRGRTPSADNATTTATASTAMSLAAARAEHDAIKQRTRAVSSVSYADLGVARHDGTRIRANSQESERPLLGDAGSIAASSRHRHRRDRSASSVLSMDSVNSDLPSPGLTRSRANSGVASTHRGSIAAGHMSSPELIDHDQDVVDEDIPLHSPPEYENIALEDGQDSPPDYSSPIATRNPEFPLIGTTGQQDSSSHLSSNPSTDSRRSSRGVGGVPQLPSLRLGNLPSIVVQDASPFPPTTGENH